MARRGGTSVGGPAAVDIFNVPGAYRGTQTGPSPGNFGITGPNVPYIEWAPRGNNTDQTSPAAFVNYGKAPSSHGHVQLKVFDFIQYTYSVPPWQDESHDLFTPDLLVFTVNKLDADYNGTHVISLPHANIIMRQNHDDFVSAQNTASLNHDLRAVKFHEHLTKYGESALEQFANAINKHSIKYIMEKWGAKYPLADMQEYLQMAVDDAFWSETQYGIRDRLSFAGSVISTNLADMLQDEERAVLGDHYTHVNVGLAKRVRTVNVFGSVDRVTTGTSVYLLLRKQGTNGPFQFFPYADNRVVYPPLIETRWMDYSGRMCHSRPYRLGVVIEPSMTSPAAASKDGASGLTPYNNKLSHAIECHGSLPTLYVAFGFKH